ncbi:hypothetical protein [Haloparvum sp. AD34]
MEPTAPSLARTYSDRVYDDPWQKVLDYRRVREFSAEHPNMGSSAASTRLELPRERIRPWMNDAKPDPVHGIQSAIDHGWLEPEPDSEIAQRLIELLAHVLAGGSIATENCRPMLTPSKRVSVEACQRAFERVGLESEVRHADDDGQGTTVVPTDDGVVLGRCLVAMGAPRGVKTQLESLPAVLHEVPADARESFAHCYARHRAAEFDDKATLRIKEERATEYLEHLAMLFRDVTGGHVTATEAGVTISADAARELQLSHSGLEQ